jgi:hypothetical protein
MRYHTYLILISLFTGILIGITAGIALTLITAYFRLNYLGFCFDKMRYLSNEEMTRLAFDEINNGGSLRMTISGEKHSMSTINIY